MHVIQVNMSPIWASDLLPSASPSVLIKYLKPVHMHLCFAHTHPNTCEFACDRHNQFFLGVNSYPFTSKRIMIWTFLTLQLTFSCFSYLNYHLLPILYLPPCVPFFSLQGKHKSYLLSEIFWLPTTGKELPFFGITIVRAVCTIYAYCLQHTCASHYFLNILFVQLGFKILGRRAVLHRHTSEILQVRFQTSAIK